MPKRRRERIETDDAPLVDNPFAALLAGRDQEPTDETSTELAGDEPKPVAPPTTASPGNESAPSLAGRLVLRRERKGRRGRGVIVIEGLRGGPAALAAVAKWARADLGTHAKVEDDRLVVGGSDMKKLSSWLRRRGATRVVEGN